MRKTTTALLGTLLGALWTATTLAAATFTVVRLTNETGCSREPSISANGKRIAFASEADLVPPGNVDANFEIFLRDQKKGLTQITTTTGGENRSPKITRNGARIAFLSDRDLVTRQRRAGLEVFSSNNKKTLASARYPRRASEPESVASASGTGTFASSCDRWRAAMPTVEAFFDHWGSRRF
jgi:Tol biopolymer transport system component